MKINLVNVPILADCKMSWQIIFLLFQSIVFQEEGGGHSLCRNVCVQKKNF